jgi:hypothetical protein
MKPLVKMPNVIHLHGRGINDNIQVGVNLR